MTNLIRLNEKGIRVYRATGSSSRVNWETRIGKLIKYNRARSVAYVIWDGRRSFDRIEAELIEPCGAAAE